MQKLKYFIATSLLSIVFILLTHHISLSPPIRRQILNQLEVVRIFNQDKTSVKVQAKISSAISESKLISSKKDVFIPQHAATKNTTPEFVDKNKDTAVNSKTYQDSNKNNSSMKINEHSEKNTTNKNKENQENNKKTEKKRYLIYWCDGSSLCGGWGDRQRGIVSVYLLSLVFNRTFGLVMSSPCDMKQFYIPNTVNWFVKRSQLKGLSTVYLSCITGHKDSPVWSSVDFNTKYPQDVVYLRTNIDYTYGMIKDPLYVKLLPKWVNGSNSQVFRKAWNKLMKYSAHFEEHVDDLLSLSPNGDFVCAHIRIRKNPTIPNDGTPINSVSTVGKLWTFLDKYVTNTTRVFIATDMMEIRKLAKKHFKEKYVDNGGVILHVDRQKKMSEACLGFETALLDQAILKQCRVLVVSHSNFSIRAAMLSDVKELFIFKNGTISRMTV